MVYRWIFNKILVVLVLNLWLIVLIFFQVLLLHCRTIVKTLFSVVITFSSYNVYISEIIALIKDIFNEIQDEK